MNKYKLYAQAWRKYGENKQIVVAMEECAELTKELSKHLRGKENLINIFSKSKGFHNLVFIDGEEG